MTVTFTEKQHVHAIAFVSPPRAGFDALFVLHTPEPGGDVRLDYRFRYDAEQEGTDEDVVRWYAFQHDPTDDPAVIEKMKEGVKTVVQSVTMFFDGDVAELIDWVPCDCDGHTAAKRMLERPWSRITRIENPDGPEPNTPGADA